MFQNHPWVQFTRKPNTQKVPPDSYYKKSYDPRDQTPRDSHDTRDSVKQANLYSGKLSEMLQY